MDEYIVLIRFNYNCLAHTASSVPSSNTSPLTITNTRFETSCHIFLYQLCKTVVDFIKLTCHCSVRHNIQYFNSGISVTIYNWTRVHMNILLKMTDTITSQSIGLPPESPCILFQGPPPVICLKHAVKQTLPSNGPHRPTAVGQHATE
jgi:hypothetical protein